MKLHRNALASACRLALGGFGMALLTACGGGGGGDPRPRRLEALVPRGEPYYRHAEGNSDSHLKTMMSGPSLSVLVSEGRLVLGRWQGVYFVELDGPRERNVTVYVV